ncbi:hypothetical protein N9H59_02920 [Flavobacteriaceae bacterium]|nr:hypothetical protein [Flavobacteriaceae bacterium]
MSRRPLKLKGWEFVKDKKHNLSTLKDSEDPSNFYYQFDGWTYSPACATIDFDNLPEI